MLKKSLFFSLCACSLAAIDFNAPGPTYAGEWTVGTSWSGSNAPLSGSIANFPLNNADWQPSVNTLGAVAASITVNGSTQLFGSQVLNLYPNNQIAIEVNKPLTTSQDFTIKFNSSGTIQLNDLFNLGNNVESVKIVGSSAPVDVLITGGGAFYVNNTSSINNPNSSLDAFSNILFKDAGSVTFGAISLIGPLQGTAQGTISIENSNILNNGRFQSLSGTAVGTCIMHSGSFVSNFQFMPITQAASGHMSLIDGYLENSRFLGLLQNQAFASYDFSGGQFLNGSMSNALLFFDDSSGSINFSGAQVDNYGQMIIFNPNSSSSATISVSSGAVYNDNAQKFIVLDQGNQVLFTQSGGLIQNQGLMASIGTGSLIDLHLNGGVFDNSDTCLQMKTLARGSITLDGGTLNLGASSSFGTVNGTTWALDGLIKSGTLSMGPTSSFFYLSGTSGICDLKIQGGDITIENPANLLYSYGPTSFFDMSSGSITNIGNFGWFQFHSSHTGTISGGTISNYGSLFRLEDQATALINMSGGNIINAPQAQFLLALDACQLDFTHTGGTIVNPLSALTYYLFKSKGSFLCDSVNFANDGGFGQIQLSNSTISFNNCSMSNTQLFIKPDKSQVDISFGSSTLINDNAAIILGFESKGTITLTNSTITNNSADRGYVLFQNSDCFINMQSGSITNYGKMFFRLDGTVGDGTLSMSGGSIFNLGETAACAISLADISIQDGYIENDSGLFAANTLSSMNLFTGANIKNVSTLGTVGVVGPCPLIMTGGTILNDGFLCLKGTSQLSSGVLNGIGTLLISGTSIINIPIAQDQIISGARSFNHAISGTPYSASVTSNSSISADLLNKQLSSFYFTGTVNGSITNYGLFGGGGTVIGSITNYGTLVAGGLNHPSEALKIIDKNLIFVGLSSYKMSFESLSSDQIRMFGGDIIIDLQGVNNPYILATAAGDFIPYTPYKIISFENPNLVNRSLKGITGGSFDLKFTQSQLRGSLDTRADGLYLIPYLASLEDIAKTPNQKQVGRALDALNGNTNVCLQDKIDQIFAQNDETIRNILTSLEPSQFKGQQVVYEELAFIINHELCLKLYDFHKGYRPYFIAGYENINQKSYWQYSGYSSNNGYQLLGFSYGFSDVQTSLAVGALESSTDYKSTHAHSTSGSVLANCGISYFKNGVSAGLDGLFGYHFIHTSRSIDFFNLQALSDHGGYSIKVQGHIDYTKTWKDVSLSPYENFGYYNGHENHFKEHGASCLNLSVETSSRNLFRNELGARAITRLQKSKKRHLHIMPYVDAAWVYEHRYHGKYYKTQFENTTPVMEIQGIGVTKNMGRLDLGLMGSSKLVDFKLNFDGMRGKGISELGASFTFDKRF